MRTQEEKIVNLKKIKVMEYPIDQGLKDLSHSQIRTLIIDSMEEE